MFVRRKFNKSGSISVQVLDKRDGRSVLVRSFGSSKIEAEVCEMERRAQDFINTYGGQTVFDFEAHLQSQRQTQLDNAFSRIVDIRQNATQIILERIYGGIAISVDKALDIAKTISTVTVALPDGTTDARIMLMTDEQRLLRPLLPSVF